jgi:hypothetical protein
VCTTTPGCSEGLKKNKLYKLRKICRILGVVLSRLLKVREKCGEIDYFL